MQSIYHFYHLIPQENFGFPAMEGLEADMVMKCIWNSYRSICW